jgi:acetylserotonin N-methyltransferase
MNVHAPLCDDRRVWDAWLSVYQGPALSAADELYLFEALHAQPAPAEELAEMMGWNPAALKTVLPLLAAQGFLAVRLGRYHLTDVATTYLLHDSPFYWGHAFSILRASPTHAMFVKAVKSKPDETGQGPGGRPADAWASGQISPEMAKGVTAFMHSHSMPAAIGAADKGDFDGVERLLDVGGGSGCFSIALAQRYPGMRCTVMELAPVCEAARGYISAAGVADRVDTRTVDMFREPWPEGYHAIFMSNIFHDWTTDTCARLAASAFGALRADGRIYLHEMIISDDGSGPLPAAAFSAMMLVGTEGRQRTFAELAGLLEDAGFTDVAVAETYGYFSLVSAFKR